MKTSRHTALKPPAVFQRIFRITARLLFLAILAEFILSSQADTERDAQRHFQEKRYESALNIYRRLARENPDIPRLAYNAGASAYRAKDMEEAKKQFANASHSPENLELQQKAYYNLGNTLFRTGETAANPEQKITAWKQSIQSYQHAISLNETDQDAQENLDFVKRRLEELQQQQQNQEQQQNNNNENQESSEQQPTSNAESNPENSPRQNNEPQPSSGLATNQEQNKENQTQQNQPNTENTAPQSPQPQPKDKEEKSPSGATLSSPGKMTPEQAKQLLDAERNQAKAMIFQPPQTHQPRNSSFKDW